MWAQYTRAALLAAAMGCGITSAFAEQDALRPAVGKPLQDAQQLIKGKQFKEALKPIDQAEAVGGLTEYERFVIAQMRGAALAGAGDANGAAASYETVLESKRLPKEDQLRIMEALSGTYLRSKNYAKAIRWIEAYEAEGGSKPEMLRLLPQAYYQAGDYANAARRAKAQIEGIEAGGGRPSEDQLKLLAASQRQQKDTAGYVQTLEQMARHYPSREVWADLIQRVSMQPGFSRSLDLDRYRLLRATDNLTEATQVMDAAQLAVQAGLPGEAKAILDEGFKARVLGVGQPADTERQNRLRTLVETKVAEDKAAIAGTDAAAAKAPSGDPLVKTGLAYVTYGDTAKGLDMMEQGLKKGSLKAADQAQLHLGYAYYLAGQRDKARTALKDVRGTDGSAALARLWSLVAARS